MSLRIVASIVLCVVGFVAFPRPCAACSCEELTMEKAYARSDVVFRGKVTEIETRQYVGAALRTYTFRADVIWKGPMTQEVKVVDQSPGSTCSVSFSKGGVYTIYGTGRVYYLQHGGICAPSESPESEGLRVIHDVSPTLVPVDPVVSASPTPAATDTVVSVSPTLAAIDPVESASVDTVASDPGGVWNPLIWIALGTVLLLGVAAVTIRRTRS